MDVIKKLDYLFDQDFIDWEQEAYFAQKTALLKGIKLSPLNGSLINYQKSNQLTDNESASLYYLLQHAFVINTLPSIRNKLSKILIFPQEVFSLKVFEKDNLLADLTHTFSDDASLKINLNFLYELSNLPQYDIKDLHFEVRLLQLSLDRLEAEEKDHIYNSHLAIAQLYTNLNEQLETLAIMNKTSLLSERIKLWGFKSYFPELLSSLGRPNLVIKNVFDLGLVSYGFFNDLSNEELLNRNYLTQSYLTKLHRLKDQINSEELIWVGN